MDSKAPLPTARALLPKPESLICPATVKQSIFNTVHPFSGPALVSPDVTTGAPPLCSLPPLSSRPPTLAQASPVPVPTFGRKEGPISPDIQILAPRSELKPKASSSVRPPPSLPKIPSIAANSHNGIKLNKFVRRLHDMLQAEKESGIVEWRRGLLVLHSTDAFARNILPKYFNTRNFKTFRRQLNYYGFVHVRSFSTTGSTTTALWVNRDLAKTGNAEISSVLMLKRVEPCESAKTAEGRRVRKEQAIFTVEEDIGVSPKSLQMAQIRSMAIRAAEAEEALAGLPDASSLLPRSVAAKAGLAVPKEVHCHLPTAAAPPPALVPKMAARQVSPVEEPKETELKHLPVHDAAVGHENSSVTNSDSTPEEQEPPVAMISKPVASDAEDAANLLLMLSKSGPAPSTIRNDVAAAITPGQFLM